MHKPQNKDLLPSSDNDEDEHVFPVINMQLAALADINFFERKCFGRDDGGQVVPGGTRGWIG